MISVLKMSWLIPMKIGRPSPSGMTNAAIVAIEIVETVAIRSPATIAGSGERQLDAESVCSRVRPMPRAASEHLGRDAAKALEDVPVEDQQRVADERDLDRRHGQAGERDEQLEEREARDRVEEVGEEPDRRVEPAVAVRDERGGERDHEADRDGDRGQLQVLESAGWSVSPQWSCTQPQQNRWFSRLARRAACRSPG